MSYEFMKYDATPMEKYIGIATVKLHGKIVLRYKIVPKKDGSGYFPTAASYKIPGDGGVDQYIAAFMLDSNFEKEEVEKLIMSNVKRIMAQQPTSFNAQASVSNYGTQYTNVQQTQAPTQTNEFQESMPF